MGGGRSFDLKPLYKIERYLRGIIETLIQLFAFETNKMEATEEGWLFNTMYLAEVAL